MAEVRGIRKTRTGVVVSNKMDKTIVVEIRTRVRPSAVWQDYEPHEPPEGAR